MNVAMASKSSKIFVWNPAKTATETIANINQSPTQNQGRTGAGSRARIRRRIDRPYWINRKGIELGPVPAAAAAATEEVEEEEEEEVGVELASA